MEDKFGNSENVERLQSYDDVRILRWYLKGNEGSEGFAEMVSHGRVSIRCGLSYLMEGRGTRFLIQCREIFQRFPRFSPVFPAKRERSILPPPTEEQNRRRSFLIG